VPGPLFWLALVATAPAADGGIAVDVPDRGCPARAQMVAALEARLPGVVGDGPGARRLELEQGPDGTKLRLRAGQTIEVERQLALDARAAASSERCEALAETAALVVVRYLREIGYRPPAVAPAIATAPAPVVQAAPVAAAPAPLGSAGYLGVGGAGRFAASSRAELSVAFALHLRRLAGELAAGATTRTVVPVPGSTDATLSLRSFPLRAAIGVPVRLGASVLVPQAGFSAELLSFRASGLVDARAGTRVVPALELGASWLLARRRIFARVGVAGGLTLGGRDFDAGLGQPVFRTPGAYLRAQVELGLVLWKNRRPASL
jgi:hypothetical protein